MNQVAKSVASQITVKGIRYQLTAVRNTAQGIITSSAVRGLRPMNDRAAPLPFNKHMAVTVDAVHSLQLSQPFITVCVFEFTLSRGFKLFAIYAKDL